MVYAALCQAASLAGIENKPWIRDLYTIQIGNLSSLNSPHVTKLTCLPQLLSNIDRVAKSHNEGKDSKPVFDEILDSKLSEEDKKRSGCCRGSKLLHGRHRNYILNPERASYEFGGPFHLWRLTSVPDHDRLPSFNPTGPRKIENRA